jgi:SAM-dependent methyltransferase
MTKENQLPEYMKVFSNRIYANEFWSGVCDDERVTTLRTLFSNDSLVIDLAKEVARNAHVLQIGLTFGNQIETIYRKICKHGKFDVFDVSDTQINRAKKKFIHYNLNIIKHDAAKPWEEKYDVVICYNLLSDVPLKTRSKIVDNVLASLSKGGKAVFVDCCRPDKWNVWKPLLKVYNLLYRPFALDLWETPIENFATNKDDYRWHHVYYGGRRFQKVTAIRKILSSEDVRKLTSMFKADKQ